MKHVELVETEDKYIITVQKKFLIPFALERALRTLQDAKPEQPHIPFISDEEQADIVQSLEAMTDEDREIGMIREVTI